MGQNVIHKFQYNFKVKKQDQTRHRKRHRGSAKDRGALLKWSATMGLRITGQVENDGVVVDVLESPGG